MRILAFSNLPPYVLGGAENQIARLVDAWINLGNVVEVAGHRIPTSVIKVETHEVRTHKIWTFSRAGRIGRAITYLISTILLLMRNRKRFDVIYCRGIGDAAISICLAKTIRLVGLPMIACPINAKGKGDAAFIKTIPGWRMLIRWINRQCNAINIIAPAIIDDLKALNIKVPTVVSIPNGISVQPYQSPKKFALFKRMVFTGRLSHQKGLDLLIAALHELNLMGYQFQLDIYGDGPLKKELKKRISELSLKNHIHLKGEIPAKEIRSKLIQYDIFILPSRYEGMSNSALEAMEAGIPVLVTRCGGIDQYIDSTNGWVCEPEDLKSIKKTLRTIMHTPSDVLQHMGRQARSMVLKNFEIGLIARKNLALFKYVFYSARK